MVQLTISAGGRAPLARGLPITLTFDKSVEDVTVADVKSAIATQFPRVSSGAYALVVHADTLRSSILHAKSYL